MSQDKRRTCYLHIGPHKTGSSSLQQFVRENEPELERLGLCYPKIPKGNGKVYRNHRMLGSGPEIGEDGDLLPDDAFWPAVDAIASAGEKDILLSHEGFVVSLPENGALDRLLKFFDKRGYAVVVIAYMRDQPGWLNSWYVQHQKRLVSLTSFDDFVENMVRIGRLDPGHYMTPFLGEPRLRVDMVSFERAVAAGLELDFIRRCGVEDVGGLISTPIRNINAGAKTVYAARQIMGRLDGPARDFDGYSRIYNEFKAFYRDLGWDSQPFVALDQARYESIRARYAPTNDAFAQEHFGVTWAELAPPRSYQPSEFDPTAAPAEEAEQVEAVVERAVSGFIKPKGKGKGKGKKQKQKAA